MANEGIEGVYVETHNWGKTAKFLQELEFELEFATDHGSGMRRNGDGAYVFVEEVPEGQGLQLQMLLRVGHASTCNPGPPVEIVKPFEATHWGTQEMHVRDPDGRIWLEPPGSAQRVRHVTSMERPEQIVARRTPLSQPPEDDESPHPRTPARRR